MPQVVVAAAAYYASSYVAATIAPALILEGIGLSAGTIGAIAGAVVTVAGNAIIASMASGPASVSGPERTQTIRQPAAPRRSIYGQPKAGGILVYASSTGDGYAHLVIAVGEGEIGGFDPVFWVGDEKSDAAKFAGLIDAHFHVGTHDQAADADLMTARPGEWTADHRLRGVAYVYVRLKFDQNAFPGGLPQLSFLPKGRKVFDPRTGLRAWSDNPALCVLDYLRTDPRAGEYFSLGMDCPDDLIDFDSFAASANICDEIIESADPLNRVGGVSNLVKRYTLNGIVDLSGSPASIVEELQGACAGRLVFSQGKYRFYAGAFYQPHPLTLTGEFLRADPSIRTKPSRQSLANVVRGKYIEPRQDWSETDYQEQRLASDVIERERGEIVQDLRLPFTSNGATAQRLAAIALAKTRTRPLTLQCNWAALTYRLWDVVTIDLPEINVHSEPFQIVQYGFAEGGGIDLVLQSESPSLYAWDASRETVVKDVVRPAFNNEPPGAVTSLAVSGAPRIESYGVVPRLLATWAYASGPFFKYFEIQYKPSAEPDYLDGGTTTSPSWTTDRVAFGDTYDVRVRVTNLDQRTSDWVEVTGTLIENDTTLPGIPTGLSVTGTGTHTITWTTPGDDDFKKSNVYGNTVNDAAGAVLIAGGSIVGLQSTVYSATNSPGGTRYYFVSSVDRTGNESALTYAGTAS